MSTSFDVVVNGQPQIVTPGTTIAQLIVQLGLDGRAVAVEKNREIIPKAQHAATVLVAGDKVELVTFVGGG